MASFLSQKNDISKAKGMVYREYCPINLEVRRLQAEKPVSEAVAIIRR